jgi:hypothetical protein
MDEVRKRIDACLRECEANPCASDKERAMKVEIILSIAQRTSQEVTGREGG